MFLWTFFENRDYIAYTLLVPVFTPNYIRAIRSEIQKLTYTARLPMIVEEILSLNALSRHHIKKTLIAIHNIINNAATTDSLKVFPCAVYLRFLNQTQLHRGHRAFGFSYKINMLYLSLIESNCTVRVIISYRCWNIEYYRKS